MKLNFNNEKEVTVTKTTVGKIVNLINEKITGNSEHLWLEYKKGKKSIEKKWLRTEYSDGEIIKEAEAFILKGFK